jgi:GxxExxY protein
LGRKGNTLKDSGLSLDLETKKLLAAKIAKKTRRGRKENHKGEQRVAKRLRIPVDLTSAYLLQNLLTAPCVNRHQHENCTGDRLDPRMRARDLTPEIIGAAIKIHGRLGPGLLESAYEACLAHELRKIGLPIDRQRAVPLWYDGIKLDCGFRADIVVANKVIVELKCKDALHPVDEAQLLSHLRLLNISVGPLINFHVVVLQDGIRRFVNNYREGWNEEEEFVATSL